MLCAGVLVEDENTSTSKAKSLQVRLCGAGAPFRPLSPIPIPSFYVPGRKKYPFSTTTKTIPPTNSRVYGNRRYVSTPNAVKIWRHIGGSELSRSGNPTGGKNRICLLAKERRTPTSSLTNIN